jgi:cell division protein FtsX
LEVEVMNRLTRTLSILVAVTVLVIAPMGTLTAMANAGAVTARICNSAALSVTLGAKGHAGASSAGFAIAITNEGITSLPS